MDGSKVLAIGLPESGKTTFLAALWGVVTSGDLAGALQLERLTGDKTYLNQIRDQWADCHKLSRTLIPDERVVSMLLGDPATDRRGEVLFRDMSGESFQRQWEERVWSVEYDQLAREAGGALLFIHPRAVKETVLIRDAQAMVEMLRGIPGAEDSVSDRTAKKLPRTPTYSSTQVQLTEFVQLILRARRNLPVRVAVVISAWDLARALDPCSPHEWLQRRLPLLWQYLRANQELVPHRVFGVSAQGGELSDADSLRRQHSPVHRIIVEDGSSTSSDITLPLRWALDL